MNEEERTGKTVTRLLDKSLSDITPGTLYRLQVARRAALEHYQPAEEVLHAGAGISVQSGLHWISSHAGRLLLTASLLFFLATHNYWQKQYRVEDKTATTPAILTHDAPSKPQKNDDTDNAYTSPDKTENEVTAKETVSQDDGGDYGDEAAASEAGREDGDIVDSDDDTDTYDPVERPGSGDAAEAPYADRTDQDSLNKEGAGNASGYAQDADDDTADFYDEENGQDATDTSRSDASEIDDPDEIGDTPR